MGPRLLKNICWQFFSPKFVPAHIFIDDAMGFNETDEWMPNMFVKQLVDVIERAAWWVDRGFIEWSGKTVLSEIRPRRAVLAGTRFLTHMNVC